MTRRLAIAASACALALPGCGEEFIDTGRAEEEIAKSVEAQTGIGIASVDCPEDVKAREGDSFECTATGDRGGEAVVLVEQTDEEGNVRFQARDLSDFGGGQAGPGQTAPGETAPGETAPAP